MKKTNKSLWIAVIGICIIGAIVGSILSFSRWQESRYFGKILSIASGSIIIEDKKIGIREVMITQDTKVFRGREDIVYPIVGEEVFVVGKKTQTGVIEALSIRVMHQKFKK